MSIMLLYCIWKINFVWILFVSSISRDVMTDVKCNTCTEISFATLAGIYELTNLFTLEVKHEGRRFTIIELEREGAHGGGEEWYSA